MAKQKKDRKTFNLGVYPIHANSFSISGTEDQIYISYAWDPPEDSDTRFVTARIALSKGLAKNLADSLSEWLEKDATNKESKQ